MSFVFVAQIKFKVWQFMQFVVSVCKTCNYLQDPAGLFFEGGSASSLGWVHKQYPSRGGHVCSGDIDDSIRRFLLSSVVVID